MNTRPKPQTAGRMLVLGSISALGVAILCSIAFLAERQQEWNPPRGGAYSLTQLAADTRQAVAIVHYLMEVERPLSPPTHPLLTQSNYSSILTTNKAHPI